MPLPIGCSVVHARPFNLCATRCRRLRMAGTGVVMAESALSKGQHSSIAGEVAVGNAEIEPGCVLALHKFRCGVGVQWFSLDLLEAAGGEQP